MNFLRSAWRSTKYLLPTLFVGRTMWKNYKCDKQEDSEQQVQTTVSKIFFASQECQFSDLKLFSIGGSSLGKQISSHLDVALGRHQTSRFNDGEISMQVFDSVNGHKVVILKTFENQSINQGLMQLLLAVSTMKKNGASHVTVVFPYFPYTINVIDKNSQDDTYDHQVYASDIARLIQSSGCDTIITLNSQLQQLRGFTGKDCNIFSLDCTAIAVPYLVHRNISNPVLIGSRPHPTISKKIISLGSAFQLFDIECGYGLFSSLEYVGDDVKDRDVILFNNVIRSGKRLQYMAYDLKKLGAKNIYMVGIHGISRQPDFTQLINSLPIKQLILTNTIESQFASKKIRCISVAKYLAEVISILHKNKSLTIFRNQRDLLKYFFLQKIRKSKHAQKIQQSEGHQVQGVDAI